MISVETIAAVFASMDGYGASQGIQGSRYPKPLAQDDPRRKCHSPECWCCHGTGVSQRPDVPGICDLNDKIPF